MIWEGAQEEHEGKKAPVPQEEPKGPGKRKGECYRGGRGQGLLADEPAVGRGGAIGRAGTERSPKKKKRRRQSKEEAKKRKRWDALAKKVAP